jgi:GDP-mannose 4,6-dehydratase
MKRVLITGITGFVGSHMADHILKNVPDVKIYGIKRWRSRDENILHLLDNKQVTFLEADLTDRGSLSRAIKQARPDTVYHFAAQSFPGASFKSPIMTLATNILGTTNLLEELKIAIDRDICEPKIVSVSSSEVYGMAKEGEIPINEDNRIRAANPYSISKVGHDLMSQYYHKAYGMNIVITRMFSHEGARRGKEFAVSSFANQIAMIEKNRENGLKPPYVISVGNLDSVRTYTHIKDAINAYWLAYEKGKSGEVYNIGSNFTCTIGEVLEDLMERSVIDRKDFEVFVDSERLRPTDITLQVPDWSKFKEHTGWNPVLQIGEINQDLLDYWRGVLKDG